MLIKNKIIHLIVLLSLLVIYACSDDAGKVTISRKRVQPKAYKESVEEHNEEPVEVEGEGEADLFDEDNNPPVIDRAKFVLNSTGTGQEIKIQAALSDPDEDDKPTLTYRWLKNGKEVGTEETLSDFKRGDVIRAEIRPYDGKAYGEERFLEIEINNSAPQVIEHNDYTFEDDIFTFQVKAVDPDGDALSYKLTKAPENMTVDGSGLVTWEVPEDYKGNVSASLVISDSNNASTNYGFSMTINKKVPSE
jgi:hypothetical protein